MGGTQPALNIAEALAKYASFHEDVLKVVDSVLVAGFEEVIADYGAVIARLNQKFDTSFDLFEHTESNVRAVFEGSGAHLSPSEARRADNGRGRELYSRASPRLRTRAEAVYERVAAHVGPRQAGPSA